ncbi:MAG: SLC13 family permease, partial [Candidatus Binatia bacterium]
MEDGAAGHWDLLRRRAGLLLAPVVFAAIWLAPFALEEKPHRLAAVLAAVIVLWVSEAIPMAATAFLGVALAILLGVAPAKDAFAPFADPLIFVFIGTFMLAQAIFFHRLDRRFALTILSLPGVGDSPARVLAAYSAVSCVLSMWISNTATTAMMYPIGISLLAAMERSGARTGVSPAYAAVLLLANPFAASIGGLATPVGTPPNLIGIGFLRREVGAEVPFFSWMLLGVPVLAVLYAVMLLDLGRSRGARSSSLGGVRERILAERRELGGWTRGQVNTLVAFGVTVFFWVLPGAVALFAGESSPAYKELVRVLPEGVVALFGATLLFLLPVDFRRHRFTLPWAEAVK